MKFRKAALSSRFGSIEKEDENLWLVLVKGIALSFIDISLTIVVGTSAFLLFSGYMFSPIERGFYCDDESIRKPLLPHTITLNHMLIVTLAGPFLVVFVCEAIVFSKLPVTTFRLRKYFSSTTGIYLEYLLAFALETLVIEASKCSFGRLRPHFLSACLPNWSLIDCDTDPSAFIPYAFCTNNSRRIRVGRGSFPSGHSAAALTCLTFLYFYLRDFILISKNTDSDHHRHVLFRRLRAFILFLFFCWTLVCCLTRITDYWHFPTDVLGGIILGFFFGRFSIQRVIDRGL